MPGTRPASFPEVIHFPPQCSIGVPDVGSIEQADGVRSRYHFLRRLPRLLRVALTPLGLLLLVLGLGCLLAYVLRNQAVAVGSGTLVSCVIVAIGLVQLFTIPPNPPFLPRSIGASRLVWLLRFLVGAIVIVVSGYVGAWSSIYLGNDIAHHQSSNSFDLLFQILVVALPFGGLILLGIYCFDMFRAKPAARAHAVEAVIHCGEPDHERADGPLARQWVSALSSNEFIWFFGSAGFFVILALIAGLGWLARAVTS